MSMDSSGQNNALIDKGAPVKIVWNQARVEGDKWLVLRGAPNLDNVMRFLAFAARPKVQAGLAGSSATRPATRARTSSWTRRPP